MRHLPRTLNELNGVIFDMDGVLCDSEALIAEAARQMFLREYGVAVQPFDFSPFVGTGEDRYLLGVAEQHGVALKLPRDKDTTYAIYLDLIPGRLRPLPGVPGTIHRLRDRGFKLAVATSADRIKMTGNLREIGLPEESFDACVTGSEVRRKKPAPDIFLKACEKLGLPPAGCVVVEDAPAGIESARRAGCACLGLLTSFDEETIRRAGADWTAPDLSRLPPECPLSERSES